VRDALAWLLLQTDDQGLAPFRGLSVRESWSREVPFRRMRVRIKREIIRMDHLNVVPAAGRAPAVDAATLARWLDHGQDDSGRPLVTLDTRNRFEVDEGTFEGAIDWDLRKFSDFPRALDEHANELEGKTVVSFCTGGIRCEKAVLLMRSIGLTHVYQLDGGILKYFESMEGAPHWQGQCVVFDERGCLDAGLAAQEPAGPAWRAGPAGRAGRAGPRVRAARRPA